LEERDPERDRGHREGAERLRDDREGDDPADPGPEPEAVERPAPVRAEVERSEDEPLSELRAADQGDQVDGGGFQGARREEEQEGDGERDSDEEPRGVGEHLLPLVEAALGDLGGGVPTDLPVDESGRKRDTGDGADREVDVDHLSPPGGRP
jgi:hypothetical protein